MRNDRNALRELQHSLENLKGSLHVLETNVPVEKQMEYFRFSEAIKSDFSDDQSLEKQINILASTEASPPEIKYALAYLAISGDVKAYRAIETYHENHSDDWSAMSYIQAKITLESELSDEKQIFISTGLGGKGDLLRFFAFFKSQGKKNFSDYQKELIEKEIPYYIQNHRGVTEDIRIRDNYFTLLFLVHIQVDIKAMLEEIVNECNQYGDFIDKEFIITNVKIFSDEEIQNELLSRQ
ncbi:MAG: hypothetical protein FWF53_12295 [Candidatus Azobacteroides sp.]|nr:hypothetical protein [Candidatus Azobacteroides sp.]